MRLRDTTICFVCIALAVCLLVVAGMRLDFINSQRQKMKLIVNEPLENAPPSLAFATVAMGAFRGLVVDILWLRADRLKQQGQFFDAKQIAEWITVLQPRFAAVWEFHAWNMAYNISVAIPQSQPQERWRWVKNGYELLRDRGIVMNPKSIQLYRELARIFQDKIGEIRDEAHKYYKLQLALMMEPLLNSPDNQYYMTDNRYFEALAKAPADWRQIIEDHSITVLITALKASDERFADDDEFVNDYLSLRQNPARFSPKALRTIDDFRGTEALKKFDIFAKAYYLRKTLKLDPVLMDRLNKELGPVDLDDPNRHLPLDWRHPDSHAIYWAVKGLETAGREDFTVVEINTDRIVNHSLQNLFRNGKIFIYDVPPPPSSDASSQTQQVPTKKVFLRSDLRMFEPYSKSVLARLEKYKEIDLEKIKTGSYKSLEIGHRNMLVNAVFSFYQAGHIPQAQKIYNQLRKLYPSDEFKKPLVGFVRKRLREELTFIGLNNAKEIVQMMLRESYFRYAVHEDNEAFDREKMAKEVYDHYQRQYPDEQRIDLPDFKLLRYFALIDFLNDQQYPFDMRLNLRARIKIERPGLAEQLEQAEQKTLETSEQSQ